MKLHVPASNPPSKRRWKGFASAVLALVFFSLLVPLAFLLGVHNRVPSGYMTDERVYQDSGFIGYGGVRDRNPVSDGERVGEGAVKKFEKEFLKDQENSTVDIHKHEAIAHSGEVQRDSWRERGPSLPKGFPSSPRVTPQSIPSSDANNDEVDEAAKRSPGEETKKPCELEFGSYCLWSIEHKEEMKDSTVKKLKDQLFVARAYYPSIAKFHSRENISREMKQSIQEHEHMLSEAIVDADLPSFAQKKMQKMEETITRAKVFNVECGNVDRKLRQILDLTEDEAHFHMRQSAFLYHLGVETMPKSLHCLSMRLTLEYFKNSLTETETEHAEKFENSSYYHYAILSKNILAASVTINSTVMNSKDSKNLVFHLLTDGHNYFAMRFWFFQNPYKGASVRVLNIEDIGIKMPQSSGIPPLSPSEEFRISLRSTDSSSQMRTEYTSVFGHSHFLLPDIFKNLNKVVVLDDDVVIQRDLTTLWSLNLQGKVLGAVQLCNVRLAQLKSYLGTSGYNNDSCTWMSGLNVIDLGKWREHGISKTYQELLQEVKIKNEASWRTAVLAINFLAFRDMIFPLEDSWVLSGLSNDYEIGVDKIEKSVALHYNGNMKPWLELGIPKYKPYWKQFLIRGNRYIDECNANP